MAVYIIYAIIWTVLMGLSYKDLINLQVRTLMLVTVIKSLNVCIIAYLICKSNL